MYTGKESMVIFWKKRINRYIKQLYSLEITNRKLLRNISIGVVWGLCEEKTKYFFCNEQFVSFENKRDFNYIINKINIFIESNYIRTNNKEIICDVAKVTKENCIKNKDDSYIELDINNKKIKKKLNEKYNLLEKCFWGQNFDLRIEKVFRKISKDFYYELEENFL